MKAPPCLCALILLFSLLFIITVDASGQPHIIFIMADDYGWANIGYHSTTNETVTPTLDALNAQGIELDRHYAYKFCSPSRCSVLSGRNPIHVYAYNSLETNYNPANNISGYGGVPINMTMISAKLKGAGYATHFTGKWDAGFATRYHLPVNRGFDTGFGYMQHGNDYWQYKDTCNCIDLWNSTAPAYSDIPPKYCNQTVQDGCVYEDDLFVAHVLDELDAHDPSVPLFYYWAVHGIHAPLQVPQSYLEKFSFIDDSKRQLYAAMVNHMDDIVASVISKLQEKDMWNNTLIVFSADNGGPLYASGSGNNYPLKGGKMSNWEGGIRVNAFLSGGFIPENVRGSKSEDFITMGDWYATFCALAGVDPTDYAGIKANLPPIDSYNMWPLLLGTNKTNPRTEIPIGTDNGGNGNNVTIQGIIAPPYKLVVDILPQSFWQGPLYPNKSTNYRNQTNLETNCGPRGCLFNIITDPTEHNDISAQFPDVVKALLERIQYHQDTVFNVDRGPVDPEACKVAKNEFNGFIGPWVDPIFS